MATLITIIHVFVSLFLILSILLQAGRGGGMGLAFGGMSQQMFGGGGAAPFLAKITSATAIAFLLTSATLAYVSSQQEDVGLMKRSETLQSEKTKAKAEIEKKRAEEEKKAQSAPEVPEVEVPTMPEVSPQNLLPEAVQVPIPVPMPTIPAPPPVPIPAIPNK